MLADNLFNEYRIPRRDKQKIYKYGGGLYPSDDLFPSDDLYPRDDYIIYDEELKQHIINVLVKHGFKESTKICEKYFIDYGLLYETNQVQITSVESLLKIISMFSLIGKFEQKTEDHVIGVAKEIYFNNGNYGLKDTFLTSYSNINIFFLQFKSIFTTNYDLILDDICNDEQKVYNLHGGFNIEHRNLKVNDRLNDKSAFLIWGIDGEDKNKKLSPGFSWDNFRWDAFRWGQSLLADYFDKLQNESFSEIHIFGYSGENDQHINQRLVRNENLRNIYFYCNPANEVDDYDFECRIKDLFKSDNIIVKLKSWTEIWDRII